MPEESNAASFKRNKQWSKAGPYVTLLSPKDEIEFQKWAKQNPDLVRGELGKTPDYDVRGRWLAEKRGDPEAKLVKSDFDGKLHASDKWKTPYHRTFSKESIYAEGNAPSWMGNKLEDQYGNTIADETPKGVKDFIKAIRDRNPDQKWTPDAQLLRGYLSKFPDEVKTLPDEYRDAAESFAKDPSWENTQRFYNQFGERLAPISISKAPQFLQGLISKVNPNIHTDNGTLVSAHNSVAETYPDSSTVHVIRPQLMDQAVLDHELTHIYQDDMVNPPQMDSRYDKNYDYGGWQGLIDARKQGKTINDYTNEQQAAMVEDYDRLRQGLDNETLPQNIRQNFLKTYDLANQAIAPYIREMARGYNNGDNTINTLPPPPAPPPATMTGIFKPLPEFGGPAVDLSGGLVKKK